MWQPVASSFREMAFIYFFGRVKKLKSKKKKKNSNTCLTRELDIDRAFCCFLPLLTTECCPWIMTRGWHIGIN